MSNWGCPHEVNEKCTIAEVRPCEPGMKGCILHGRFVISNASKRRSENKSDKTPGKSSSKTHHRRK